MAAKRLANSYDILDKNIGPFEISSEYALTTFAYSDFVTLIYDKRSYNLNVNVNSSRFNTSDYRYIPWKHLIGIRGLHNCFFRPNGIIYFRNNELDVIFKVHICF